MQNQDLRTSVFVLLTTGALAVYSFDSLADDSKVSPAPTIAIHIPADPSSTVPQSKAARLLAPLKKEDILRELDRVRYLYGKMGDIKILCHQNELRLRQNSTLLLDKSLSARARRELEKQKNRADEDMARQQKLAEAFNRQAEDVLGKLKSQIKQHSDTSEIEAAIEKIRLEKKLIEISRLSQEPGQVDSMRDLSKSVGEARVLLTSYGI